MAEIKAHNENPDQSWKKGENQFSALTDEEFENLYLGLVVPKGVKDTKVQSSHPKVSLKENSSEDLDDE